MILDGDIVIINDKDSKHYKREGIAKTTMLCYTLVLFPDVDIINNPGEKFAWILTDLLINKGDGIVEAKKEFHSSHYESRIEPIQYIMANKLSFNRGNIIKYATRAGKKSGQEKLDIHKIIDYAMLTAIEDGIELNEEELIDLIKYRLSWRAKSYE